MLYREIGQRIRAHRISRGISQERLAEMADISLSFMGHIERGTRKMSVETLYKLLVALNCSADEVLGLLIQPGTKQQYAQEILQRVMQMLDHEM